jgi:hypothetical protein
MAISFFQWIIRRAIKTTDPPQKNKLPSRGRTVLSGNAYIHTRAITTPDSERNKIEKVMTQEWKALVT